MTEAQDQQRDNMKARNEQAKKERDMMLAHLYRLCQQDQREKVIPTVIANMRSHPAVGGIRLWQLDSVMFNVSRRSACRLIRRMRETISDQSHVKDGFTTVRWALESPEATVRMTTWLWMLLLREKLATFEIPKGFPYAQLFEPEGMEGKGF